MLQKDQMTRQNDEIAMLREVMQKMQDSFAAVAAAAAVPPELLPQSPPIQGISTQADELVDTSLARDAGQDCPVTVSEVEDSNQH